MSYNNRFYANIRTFAGEQFDIYIKKLNYTGSSEQITKYSLYPLTFSYNGSEEDDYIAGSECKFQFYCLSGKSATYNEIFESNYKDYQVVIYKDSELYWQGWLNPENLSKNFIGENYFISLSANDGIADLKDIEYPAVADTSARMSILEVIQNCLMQTGINLNIEIQLNTYESALMTSTEQALEKATILLSRVIEVKDNILSYKKCYDLIKELLTEFECRLIQAEGKWIITNKHELNSYKHVYLYSGTTRQSRTSITNVKNISNTNFYNRGDLSKIPPVKQAALVYQNKNLGESLLSYSSDFWTKSTENGFYVNYYSNYLEFSLVGSQIVSSTISPYIYSDAFYVENISDDDYLRVSFNYALDEDVQSLIEEYYYNIPKFRLLVKTPYDADFVAKATWDADSTEIQELSCDVPIATSGNYQVKIQLLSWQITGVTRTYTITNLNTAAFYSDATGTTSTTWDKIFKAVASGTTAIKSQEMEVIFGDGLQSNDVGNFKIDSTLTSLWRRYNKTDDKNIQFIKLQYYLNNLQRFKDNLKIEFDTSGETINFNNVIQIGSKYYYFSSYDFDVVKGSINAELIELLTTDVSTINTILTTSAIDGQSSTSTSTSVSSSGGIEYSAGNGIIISGSEISAAYGTGSTYVACGSHTHSNYLSITGCAFDSAKLGNHLPNYYSTTGHSHTLNSLSDVDTAPFNGHILFYTGTTWQSAPTCELTLSSGQILYYDGTTISTCANNAHAHAASCITSGTLTAARLPIASASCLGGIRIGTGLSIDGSGIVCVSGGTGGATCLDGLSDVNIASPSNGHIIIYSGSSWCNMASTDICGNLSTGEVLCFNGTTITGVTTVSCAGSATNALALCGCIPTCFAAAIHCHCNLYNSTSIKACTTTGGLCVCGCAYATDFVASSDCRLKTAISPIYSALSTVDRLCGVNYKLCADTEKCRMGMIAQNVKKIVPEVVYESNEDGMLGIDYSKLVPLLVEAIKEMKKELDLYKLYSI